MESIKDTSIFDGRNIIADYAFLAVKNTRIPDVKEKFLCEP